MNIKKLQAQLTAGTITKAQYQAELKKLLEAETIDQEDYDDAKEFDAAANEKVYTQADVDGFIAKKATTMLRKVCKDAGLDLDGVGNKDLAAHVTEKLKAAPGDKKAGEGKEGDEATAKLIKKAAKADALLGQVKDLSVELAVIKALATDYKGVNPVQVLRAVKLDYRDDIEVDEDGDTIKVDRASVDRVLKAIKKAEPNLLKKAASAEGDDENDENDDQEEGAGSGTFHSKAPGGGTKPVKKSLEADKEKALAMMGIPTKKQQ